MRALLVRVGADQSEGGGHWNGPVNGTTGKFAYVPIPETFPIRRGFKKPYHLTASSVRRFGVTLPKNLERSNMHLDPDFEYLTYGDRGDRGSRGAQIKEKLGRGDLLVFYAALADVNPNPQLVYAIIGLYVIESITLALAAKKLRWHENAHTRRVLRPGATDVLVRARSGVSGRLTKCLPIGAFRNRAYRVTRPLLKCWGGLSVRDGYIQRSARLPEILDAKSFYDWLNRQNVRLRSENN